MNYVDEKYNLVKIYIKIPLKLFRIKNLKLKINKNAKPKSRYQT